MERVLTELITAGACDLWRLRAIWPCVLVALLDRQTFWRWVRVRLPKWPVKWMLMLPQHRRPGFSTFRP